MEKRPQTAEEFLKLLEESPQEDSVLRPMTAEELETQQACRNKEVEKEAEKEAVPPIEDSETQYAPKNIRKLWYLFFGLLFIATIGVSIFIYNRNSKDDTEAGSKTQIASSRNTPETTPPPPPSYPNAVKALKNADTSGEGLEMLQTLSDNGDSNATYLLSRLYFKSKLASDYVPDSITAMRKNVDIKTDNVLAHNLLKKAIEQNPDNYYALYELACDYWKSVQRTDAIPARQGEEAEKLYKSALTLAKKQNDALYVKMINGYLANIKTWKENMAELQ